MFIRDKLDVLNKYDNIYQINISLHSENNKSNYIDDIFIVLISYLVMLVIDFGHWIKVWIL